MPVRALLVLVSAAMLAGCGHPGPAGSATASRAAALAASARIDAALKADLARFSKEEGRKVSAKDVKMNQGLGAGELRVPLSPEEQTLLVQLYRLHPRAVPADQFPAGLIARTRAHLASLHRFKLPAAPRLDPGALATEMRTRVYRDGDGQTLAYESFVATDTFQLFGKYDLQGRILKVDIETF